MKSTKAIRASSLFSVICTVASVTLLSVIIFLCVLGTLNPRKVRLGIQTETVSRQYDGEPLVSNSITITYGNLIDGHELMTMGCNELIGVGKMENVLDITVVDSTGADVTDMYDLDISYGTLTVTPRKISIKSETKSKTYDGKPLVSSTVSVSSGKLGRQDTLYSSKENSITEVGTIENKLSYYILNKDGTDVTDCYDISVSYGTLKVQPKTITIKTSGNTTIYNGSPNYLEEWSITSGKLEEGASIHLNFPELTEVGNIKNIPAVTITDQSGADVTNRYKINITSGMLTVKPIPIKVSTGGASKIYDGNPISNTQWSLISGQLMSGHTIRAVEYPKVTNAGVRKNTITFAITDSQGNDVTSCYEITYEAGDLTVQPKPISITTGSARKKYDGNPIGSDTYTLKKGSLCTNHYIEFSGSERTEVGSSPNIGTSLIIYKKEANGTNIDVTKNYNITYSFGTLTVTN